MKVFLVVALAMAAHGAPASPLDLIDNLQELLINPEAMDVRVKRSPSGTWDKEFDLGVLGVSFRIKYIDAAHPLKGGHAHVTFPGRKYIAGANFDNVDLDIHFNGGDAIDGIFDMKIDYKFDEKFMFMADRPQAGSVMIYRKLEGGMWKTKMTVDNVNRTPNPFLNFEAESDHATKLFAKFQYDADNAWEIKIDRVPGQSITGVVTINGVVYKMVGTLDMAAKKLNIKLVNFPHGKTHELDIKLTTAGEYGLFVTGNVDGPVDVKMVFKKDFKAVDFVVKHNNKNFAYVKLNGDAVMEGLIPKKVDYIMKYNIMNSMLEGKAKVNFNGQAPAKTLRISFVPKTGKDLTMDFKWEGNLMSKTHKVTKFEFESTRAGVTYTKFHHEADIKNTAAVFSTDMKNEITMDSESIFYNFFCWKVGKCFLHGVRDVKVMYNKKERNFAMGKMMFKDVSMVDGVRYQEKKIDTTTTPYVMTWYMPYGPTWMYNTHELFGLEEVEVKVWHKIGKELIIETNIDNMKLTIRRNPDYFIEFIKDGETRLRSLTEVTPAMFTTNIDTIVYLPSSSLFHKVFCQYGKGCFNRREGHMKIVVDRHNKNALINKFMIESQIIKDTDQVLDLKLDTMVSPYTFHMNAPYILPKIFSDVRMHTIDATINHEMGKMLEIKSNCPEFEDFKITTNGATRTVMLNGKELTVVNYARGAKTISQTTKLPSGEHLTTTVEWTKDTMKTNKAIVTIKVTPNRMFKGIVEWDFQTMTMGNLMFDLSGKSPLIGDYKVKRNVNWNVAAPLFIFNWVGKSEFTTGPLSPFSPIDSKFMVDFDSRRMQLNAELLETVRGKNFGVKVAKNRFTLLTGQAA
jgi:hypothetical protein